MRKKLLIFIVIFLALLAAVFAYNYFTKPVVNAPTINSESQVNETNGTKANGNFRGPTGAPSVKGPSDPPPSN